MLLVLTGLGGRAATVTWNGDNPELEAVWTTDGNWYGGTAPSPGDSLVFGTGLIANANDFPADTAFTSITFTNGGYVLSGNAIKLTNTGVAVLWNQPGAAANPNVIDMPVVFSMPAEISSLAQGSALVFTRAVANGGNLLTVSSAAGASIALNGAILGAGGLVKQGPGTLTLGSAGNNYSGGTTITAGTLVLGAGQVIPSGLGNGDVVINGTLDLNAQNQDLNGLSGSGTITNSGSKIVELTLCNNDLKRTFTFDGYIRGALNLVKVKPLPVLVLTKQNAYTGDTTIRYGVLRIGTNNALPPTTALTMGIDGTTATLDLGGYSQQLAGLAYGSSNACVITNSSLSSASTLTFSNAVVPSIYRGQVLDGPGTKMNITVAAGTLTLDQPANTYSGWSLATNAGSELIVGTGQKGGGSFIAADGASLGISVTASNGTLNMSSLTLGHSTAHNGSFDIDLGAFGNPTTAPVTTASLSARGTVRVNVAGSRVRVGRFPLISYAGTIGGAGFTAFVLGSVPPGITAQLTNNTVKGSVDLRITGYAGSLTWRGETNGIPVSTWKSGGPTNWTDQVTGLPAAYTEAGPTGQLVLFDDSASNAVVNITSAVKPFSVTVTNETLNYSIGGLGPMTGTASLVKQGSGLLVLTSSNAYSGDTTIAAGTVKLGANGAIPGGAGKGNVVVNGTLDLAGFTETINGLSGNGTVDNTTGSGALTAGNNDQASAFQGTLQNTGGSLALTKVGAGTLVLSGTNSYSGATRVLAGTLATTTGGQAPGLLAVSNQATLAVSVSSAGSTLRASSFVLGTGAADVTTNSFDFGVFGNPPTPVIHATNLTLNGVNVINITGSGFTVGNITLIQYAGAIVGPGSSFVLGSVPTGFAAYLTNIPGKVQLVITDPGTYVWIGNVNANWDIGATANWRLNGVPITYHDGDSVLFDGRGALQNQVNLVSDVAPGDITVRNPTNDYSLGGPGRLKGPANLTKTGAGILTLNTADMLTGNTLVNGGGLKLGANGSITSSASIVVASNAVFDVSAPSRGFTVVSNSTLGGFGTITGAVTVAGGAFLAPGAVPGNLTFRNSLDLEGTVTMQTLKSGGLLSSSKIAVNGLLTYGPASTLNVVHSGDALVGGEVFHLFDAAPFNGAFYSWNLPTLAAGLNWCLNNLTVNGTLSVNRAPVAANLAMQTTPGVPLFLNVADLMSLCSDPDGDRLLIISVGNPSQGIAYLDSDRATLIYEPPSNFTGTDRFTYAIADGRGGQAIGTNSVLVTGPSGSPYNRLSIPVLAGGEVSVDLAGVPGDTYTIQRSTNLVNWVDIGMEIVPTNGLLVFQDTSLPVPPPPTVFYRAVFELGTGESLAAQILQATGVKGGFVAHVGCGDGSLTAGLQRNSSYRVQGLDRSPANVAAAREYIMSLGAYGYVSADGWDGAHLPYIDNFVNLAVVQDMGTMSTNEIIRVLAPLGVAYNIQPGAAWQKIVKPRPPEISDWTHFAYDASGNCVAPDTVVGPPKRYQWLAGPKFNRHHDVMSSFNAGVSANGRLFHVMDEGSRESILLPGEWFLVARDAFNGTLLWKRPISSWHPSLYGLKSGPTQLTRRLVAVGDVVYVTLDYYGPVVALDAATGATLRTYDQTSAAQEIYLSHGTLFVLVDPNPKQWATWEDYYNTSICMNTPSTNWNDHARVITALNAATGQLLWTNSATVYPTSIAVDTNGLVFHDGMYVRKLDRNTGASLWTSSIPVPVLSPTYTANGLSMILYKDTVLMAGGPGKGAQNQNMNGYIWSVDSASGQVLTNWIHGQNSHLHSPNDLFVFPGLTNDWVWSTSAGATNPMCVGYDRRTGTPMRTNDPGIYIDWIHERCYRSKATVNYFLTSRACLEVIDARATNWGVKNDWVRSACLYGFIPCNGLIYTTPNDCSCQFEAKLTGLGALAPASTDPSYPPNQPDGLRLQPGAAYGQAVAANPSPDDWPIYRHDQDRSGYTSTSVPAALSLGWQTALGGKLSSLTVAEGRVFVASVDTHTVFALDVAAGTNVWSYTVGGRVDSPPTIYKGRVLFGSADGYVYCLRATDGALIWRFLAAFTDRRHMSYEQVESVWPVSGSVLAVNDKIYCVAGRSMYLDGGCKFWALNPTNGAILAAKNLDDKVPGSTNSLTTLEKTYNGPVALADLLSSDGQRIFMKSQWFDLNGVRTNIGPNSPIPAINAGYPNQIGDGVHLFTPTGFLDDNWMHRSYWVWGKYWSSGAGGYYIAGKNAPCGQILSIDDSNVYGFGRKPQYYRWTVPKENMLFSTSKANNFNGSGNPFNWTNTLPFFVKAMVATPDFLFLAGPPDVENEEQSFATLNDSQTQADLADQDAALHGAQGGQLRVVSKADGSTLASYSVDFLPVWDGMAAAGQRLFMATRDGRVVCYHRRP